MSTYTSAITISWRRAAFLWFVLLLSALSLAACGDDAPAAETATVAAQELAATEPAAETEPEEVAVQPTADAAPTEASPATAAPTLAPTPTLAAETGAADLAAGDCGNEFFPVVEGRVVRYTNDVPGFGVSEFTQTTSDVTDSSFSVITDVGEGDALVFSWRCSGDGLLAPELSQLPGAEGLTIEYTEASGISIPPADRFRPGETWTTHYVANATLGDPGAGAMTMVETIDLVNEVVGVEAISVAAGDFPDAVRVETTGNITIAMLLDGAAQPANDVPMSYTSWYVAGVGLVRQEFAGLFGDAGAPMVTELVAVE